MELLQEAIEKARKQREGNIGNTAPPGQSGAGRVEGGIESPQDSAAAEGVTARTSAPESEEAALQSPPDEIRYMSTRKVEPKEEFLSHNRVIAGQIHDPRVEVYRQLRSQILLTMRRNNWHTLAITSADEGAGKTLTSVNLAISISKEVNQTVMLVDLDLRKPNVHTTLGIEIEKGLVDHLKKDEPIENVLINPNYPRLVVLPCLPQGRSSSELLSSPAMKRFLFEITNRYPDRLIIYDLPPLLRNDDAMVFIPNADACLLVVEDGVTTPDNLSRALSLLKHSHLIGTILNKAR